MPLFSRICSAALATTLCTMAQADLSDLPPVRRYVSDWKAHDGQQVLQSFSDDCSSAPDSAARHLVAEYVALHQAPSRAGIAALQYRGCATTQSNSRLPR